MASYEKAVESYKKAVTTAASVAATAMLLRGVVNELVPHEFRDLIFSGIHDLRSCMSSQQIIVIEETEGYANNQIYEAARLYHVHFDQVTLSGLLNFVDGLWSTSGEERIIVFTTNYKERLDPALLRPGRMDMQIHMSYCGIDAFRLLASNYHAINDHELFPEIEGLIREIEVTPAAVAEELMRSDDTNAALQGLLDFLKAKRKGNNEDKVEEQNVEDKDKTR